MCTCVFDGKAEKRRGKGVGDVMREYNKDKFKFYFTHREELSMRFIKSKYVIIQATHTSSIQHFERFLHANCVN